ncbi:carbon-nitrogen hydrolase family protein [Pseudooceanicola sp.]|uniref:carbon-nitrogen hydrolase family protein n=1 Tax=Pseudooceanicola sp. TaxID=1914328 RepID=UPI00262A3706|nr:carbon-nitrogen hydrolase family protein [Pseudooceanicola sp.]MDF1857306.1 carbon-nitrogen hydrolase family protein [Pseudooceanicola sp.]
MKIATAAYPLDWFSGWSGYEAKLGTWVAEAAGQGADLLVFPEYGAMELVSLSGVEVAADTRAAMQAVADRMSDANALHRDLARRHQVYILGGSAPVRAAAGFVNRAHFHSPAGETVFQDKLILTPWERDPMQALGQGPLKLFQTGLGNIAINICYDSEFPLLSRAQSGADLLLIPSTTEAASGYWRVRIAARARALEGQCVSVMASTIGAYPRLELLESSFGGGGIFVPPDGGFPADGILASGVVNQPGWTLAEVDLIAIRALRDQGAVRNRTDWAESQDLAPVETVDLR